MTVSVSKTLISAVAGGATAFIFAPLLWPVVILFGAGGFWGFDSSHLAGLLVMSAFALGFGLLIGLFIGFPLLFALQKLGIENNVLVIFAGAMVSVVIFSGFLSWPVSAWPVYLFLSVVGGMCGMVAVWLLRSNFHRTRPPSAAGELKR